MMFKEYCQRLLDRPSIERILGIGRSWFFALPSKYLHLHDPNGFYITYETASRPGLPACVHTEIEKELMLEKNLIDDCTLPIANYNCTAIRGRLIKRDIRVSSPTIIARAKSLGCYQPYLKGRVLLTRKTNSEWLSDDICIQS
jgi:hypothetical protein